MVYLLTIVAIFFTELWLLVKVGGQIGALSTVAATVLTAVIGLALVKRQGINTLARAQAKQRQGDSPANEMLEGVALLIAGLCLLVPGFMTDAIGFILLLPGLRAVWAKQLLAHLQRSKGFRFRSSKAPGNVFEGEFERSGQPERDADKKNRNFLP